MPVPVGVSHLVGLDDEACVDRSVAGGKGASLASLLQEGFPVPPGFVIAARAYDDVVCAAGDPVPAGAGGERPVMGNRIRHRLTGAGLPWELRRQVAETLSEFDSEQAFAVRSSATLEDLAEAAFAGMHETRLNCRGVGAVLDAVQACYESLWSEEAIAYRQHHGFAHREARMAVVVQTMIDCDVAGVGFSLHPVTGDPRTIVINANTGLGESVVNGEHEVDHFEIDRISRQVTRSRTGRKTTRVACNREGGGVVTEHVAKLDLTQPCLDSGQLARLAELQVAVDTACGFPQDIEWGIAGESLHLLQARPVTRIPARWTRDESAERYPNAITPLTWDMVERGFHESLRFSMSLMGMPVYGGKWFASHGHYIYGNQNAVALYLGRPAFEVRSLDELRNTIPMLRDKYRWVQDLPVRWARDLDAYLLEVGRLSAEPVENREIGEIWDQVTNILQAGTEYFLPNIAISITQAKLHQVLFMLVKLVVGEEEAPGMFDALVAFCETSTWGINRELFELARFAREDPGLVNLLDRCTSRKILGEEMLAAHPEFAGRFEQLVQRHGHRELEFDAYCPTWVEVPWIVLDNLRLVLQSLDEAESPVWKERELRLRMHEAEAGFLERVPEDLRFFCRELLRLARTYTSLDDREHYQTTRLNPPMRRALRALGNHLARRGLLDDPMDVFFSRFDDLEQAVKSGCHDSWNEWAGQVRANKTAFLADKEREPEQVLGGESGRTAATDGALAGLPGSPGVAEGPVSLVRSEEDFARFPKGSVLVARTTSPSWTPLFYSAAAVITESGGPLSHGAVIARELHIPAVMGMRGALTVLREGQRVRVDGMRGTIEVVK